MKVGDEITVLKMNAGEIVYEGNGWFRIN